MTPQELMRQCFRLALRGKGHVSPNPMVGALLVKDNRIVARGYHKRFGGPHAEADCLRRYPGDVRDATLYVNLEPCADYGKTPPCVDLILSRGVGTVIAAMEDPNPRVAGRGLQKLRRAGVRIGFGELEGEAKALNRKFAVHIVAHRPYVHVKIAQSRDGRITGGRTRWISSLQSRKRVHAMRAEHDAVLVGAGTVRADDPLLNARLVSGRDPAVAILDGAFSLQPAMKLFVPEKSRQVFLFTSMHALRRNPGKAQTLAARGTTVIGLPGTGEQLNLRRVLKELYRRDIASVLVEGGARVFAQCFAEGLVDEVTLFVAPDFFGKGLAAIAPEVMNSRCQRRPESVVIRKSGRDQMINILFKQPGK